MLVEESVPFPLTHPVTPDPAAPAELPVPMRPGCAHLVGGGRVCFFRTDTVGLAAGWVWRVVAVGVTRTLSEVARPCRQGGRA